MRISSKVIITVSIILFALVFGSGFLIGLHMGNDWDSGYKSGWMEARSNGKKWVQQEKLTVAGASDEGVRKVVEGK